MAQGSGPYADQELVDAPIEGVYREDPTPPNLEDEASKEATTGGEPLDYQVVIGLVRLPAY